MNWSEIKVGQRYGFTRNRMVEGIDNELVGIKVESKFTEERGHGISRFVKGTMFIEDGVIIQETKDTQLPQDALYHLWIPTDAEKIRLTKENDVRKELQENIAEKVQSIIKELAIKGIIAEELSYSFRIGVNGQKQTYDNLMQGVDSLDKFIEILQNN